MILTRNLTIYSKFCKNLTQVRFKSTKKYQVPSLTVPPPPTEPLLKLSAQVFNQPCSYLDSFEEYDPDTWPNKNLPEIAFVGVKGAGKSTLLTGLLEQKKLPKKSRAQKSLNRINVFNASDRFSFVDFPGFTYKERDTFNFMFESYLQSETLFNRIVCVVIEAKMELNHYDHLILKMLDKHQVPYQVILTKMDKFAPQLWPTLLDTQENELCSYLTKYGSSSLPHVILTSSLHNKTGFELLKCSILESVINAN